MVRARAIARVILIAFLATASVEAIRYLFFIPLFGFSPRSTLPFLSIILATWFGGLGAGLLATALNAVVSWGLIGVDLRFHPITIPQQVRLYTFIGVSAIIVAGINGLRTSQRRAAERQLSLEAEVARRRQAEARFREVAMFAPVGIFETDANGEGLFTNQAWSEITGMKAEDALGNGWARLVHPDDQELVFTGWQNATRGRRTDVTEFRFVNKTRGIRWVVASTKAILDASGAVAGFVGTLIDVTERKAAEDAVRASEARLRSILDNTPAIISLKDREGRYVIVNRRWEQLFDVTLEQIVGRTNEDLIKLTSSPHMSRQIADKFLEIDRTVLETGVAVEFEDPEQLGEVPLFLVTVKFPIRDAVGKITGVGGISIDITERRQALDALAAEQELLNHTIAVQDQERQLIAYEIHDGLLQYVAGALLQLEALQARVPAAVTDDLDRILTVLQRAVNEGRRLINGIRTPVLDGLGVVAAIENLIEEEERAHVTIEFVKRDEIGRLEAKIEEALYRICQEALTNIAKHSQAKKVRIELSRHEDRVRLEIRDWGIGFVPATRPNNAVHGLRGMMERARIAGGSCTVESEPGSGTKIVVELPYTARTSSVA